jgi:hypothetical protein
VVRTRCIAGYTEPTDHIPAVAICSICCRRSACWADTGVAKLTAANADMIQKRMTIPPFGE